MRQLSSALRPQPDRRATRSFAVDYLHLWRSAQQRRLGTWHRSSRLNDNGQLNTAQLFYTVVDGKHRFT